ncbi:hypothetical protein ACFQ0O_38410 [Saccharopolyspora spinosporotrichia]
MIGHLGLQTPLEHGFDQLGQKPALPGQRQPAPVDGVHHPIEQACLDHLIDRVPR